MSIRQDVIEYGKAIMGIRQDMAIEARQLRQGNNYVNRRQGSKARRSINARKVRHDMSIRQDMAIRQDVIEYGKAIVGIR